MNCLIKTRHIERQLALAVTWVMEQKMDFYSTSHIPCLLELSQRRESDASDFAGAVAGTAPSASAARCTKQRLAGTVGVLQNGSPQGPKRHRNPRMGEPGSPTHPGVNNSSGTHRFYAWQGPLLLPILELITISVPNRAFMKSLAPRDSGWCSGDLPGLS